MLVTLSTKGSYRHQIRRHNGKDLEHQIVDTRTREVTVRTIDPKHARLCMRFAR